MIEGLIAIKTVKPATVTDRCSIIVADLTTKSKVSAKNFV